MHIGFVSTYPPIRCAIGLYSQKLAYGLAELAPRTSIFVAAELGADPEQAFEGRLEARPVYARDGDYRDAIFHAVRDAGVNLVHFQYAHDLFGEDQRLPSLLKRLKEAGIQPVVTLHTVYDPRHWRKLLFMQSSDTFHRAIAESAHIVVHHADGMATKLKKQGIPEERISIIPHGTSTMELMNRDEARAKLGLPADAFVFTFFGFIHRLKNVHTVVEGFIRASGDLPDARLLVAGMPWGGRWYNHLYVGALKARAACSLARDRILIRDEYLPPELVPAIYSASDVIVLPHNQSYGSASGVFHQAIGYGRPVLCARGPKFVSARELFREMPELCVPPGSVGKWAQAMVRIRRDTALRERSRVAVARFARETAWTAVAGLHDGLYRRILSA
jgi:glycosyltransferase involved in cell wall biosynthesis